MKVLTSVALVDAWIDGAVKSTMREVDQAENERLYKAMRGLVEQSRSMFFACTVDINSGGDWPQTMDGMVWAEKFNKRFPQVSVDDCLGWFCNAIMAGYDTCNSKLLTSMSGHLQLGETAKECLNRYVLQLSEEKAKNKELTEKLNERQS